MSELSLEVQSKLKGWYGNLYDLDDRDWIWKIMCGPRTVVEMKDPWGYPVYKLVEPFQQELWSDYKKVSAKWKMEQDAAAMQTKWEKDIKSRKYTEKREVKEGDEIVQGVFNSDGERVG